MKREDALKVLESGTDKQRLKLLEDLWSLGMGYGGHHDDWPLTEIEFQALEKSFSVSGTSMRVFRENLRTLNHAVQGLQTSYYFALKTISDLNGFIALWESYRVFEKMINIALDGIADEQRKIETVQKIGFKGGNYPFSFNAVYDSGEFEIDINPSEEYAGEPNLINTIRKTREDVIYSVSHFKTSLAVITDWIQIEKLKPRKYLEMFKEWDDDILRSAVAWKEYLEGAASEADTEEQKKLRVFPDISKIEVNKELYKELQQTLGVSHE